MSNEYISRETVLKYVEDWSCGYGYIETETKRIIRTSNDRHELEVLINGETP